MAAGRIPPKQRAQQAPDVQEGGSFELDYTDLAIGLVIMVVLPAFVALALGFMDMPLSGNTQARRDAVKTERQKQATPSITEQELRDRMDRVDDLIGSKVPMFRTRYAEDFNDRGAQDQWYKCVLLCIEAAEAELKEMETALMDPTAEKLSRHLSSVQNRLNDILQLRGDLNKDRPL